MPRKAHQTSDSLRESSSQAVIQFFCVRQEIPNTVLREHATLEPGWQSGGLVIGIVLFPSV